MDSGKGEMCSQVKEDGGQAACSDLFLFVILKTGSSPAGFLPQSDPVHFNHSTTARGLNKEP